MNADARDGPPTAAGDPAARAATGPLRERRREAAFAFEPLYDRAVAELLDVPVEERWVETRHGRTHLLLAGDPDAPPVVVFQGGNVTAPVTLAWVQGLAATRRLIAPDTPGQPGLSGGEDPGAGEFGPWVVDVLDALGLDAVPMVGLSHGAGVVLEAAAHAPERVAAAVLVVPAGFGTAPSLSLVRVVFPSLAHRLTGSRWLLDRALAGLFTEPPGDVPAVSRDTIGLALRTGDLGARFPGPEGPDALAGFAAPALVVTAEHDPFFPPVRTVDRAERWLPGPVESVVLDGERHFLSPGARQAVTARIDAFLSAAVDGTPPGGPDGSL